MTLTVFVAVNKNGSIRMFTDEPKRNVNSGRWESDNPFVNSKLFKDFTSLCQKANVTWESEPNPFTLEIKNTKK